MKSQIERYWLWQRNGFYNRVGTLINLRLVEGRSILRTIGGPAFAVWRKVQPLIEGARRENPGFLVDFERLLPHCKECIDELSAQRP